jgi:hypothetical protein
MFLYIKHRGLHFRFRNRNYTTPVEIEFEKHQLEDVLIKLRDSDIDDFVISNESKIKRKSRVINNVKEKNININIDNITSSDEILKILLNKLNDLEEKIVQPTIINKTYIGNEGSSADDKCIKSDIDEPDKFIPDIDISGMELDNSDSIKIENSADDSQESSADLLRNVLGDK